MPFREVSGHRRVLDLLARSIARDSLPPSLIFAGPSKADAAVTALAVAQALNCLRPVVEASPNPPQSGLDACGTCVSCLRIARGMHPDVMVIEPGETGTIRIEPVRDATERAAYRPFEGRRRVVIVNGADALVPAAQNALLKTLEEPPSSSVFVLVTARPDVLLPTVRSRCIRLWFAEGAADEIDEEAREIAEQVLGQVAAAAPRQRLEATRDLLSNTGAGGASDRNQLAATLRAMAALLRDAAVIGARGEAGQLVNRDRRGSIDRLAQAYSGDRSVRAFAAVDEALAALERNAGVKIVADWLVLEL
jgi:DNA polymerase III subunit delta'